MNMKSNPYILFRKFNLAWFATSLIWLIFICAIMIRIFEPWKLTNYSGISKLSLSNWQLIVIFIAGIFGLTSHQFTKPRELWQVRIWQVCCLILTLIGFWMLWDGSSAGLLLCIAGSIWSRQWKRGQ
jgi:hypothetical protein